MQREINIDVYVDNYCNSLQILAISALALGNMGDGYYKLTYRTTVTG